MKKGFQISVKVQQRAADLLSDQLDSRLELVVKDGDQEI